MSARISLLLVGFAVVCGCVFVVGCEKPDPTMQKIDSSNLRTLAMLWGSIKSQTQGRPPKSEEEFKALIKKLPPAQLEAMKVGDVDKLFVSERDNKPYIVFYGQPAAGGSGEAVMAYEQEGKDGKRFVALTYGQVKEVDAAEFQKLVPAAKKP